MSNYNLELASQMLKDADHFLDLALQDIKKHEGESGDWFRLKRLREDVDNYRDQVIGKML